MSLRRIAAAVSSRRSAEGRGMSYNPKDYYFRKAKAENYAARSIFKIGSPG